jgi:hypothetical protein
MNCWVHLLPLLWHRLCVASVEYKLCHVSGTVSHVRYGLSAFRAQSSWLCTVRTKWCPEHLVLYSMDWVHMEPRTVALEESGLSAYGAQNSCPWRVWTDCIWSPEQLPLKSVDWVVTMEAILSGLDVQFVFLDVAFNQCWTSSAEWAGAWPLWDHNLCCLMPDVQLQTASREQFTESRNIIEQSACQVVDRGPRQGLLRFQPLPWLWNALDTHVRW